ncbi:MAG TPA: hypothetical protein VME21_05010 [Steroidobacteraceae bacterium]|nr:hypothetical protein [Steroidobacteraceae bacterium]
MSAVQPEHPGAESAAATQSIPPAVRSLFLPGLLLGVAVLGAFVFQTAELLYQRSAVRAAILAQQAHIEQSQKLRAALDALAASTLRLADSGDPNAKLVVDELRKRGININPNGPPLSAPPK